MTPLQAANRLQRFRKGYMTAVLRGMRKGCRIALRTSLTRFMQRMGPETPPNPPPGPLARRTGALARGVRVMPALMQGPNKVIGGLESTIVYGRIHELGGLAGPTRKRVRIPARPYLRPALEATDMVMFVRREVSILGRNALGPLWRTVTGGSSMLSN